MGGGLWLIGGDIGVRWMLLEVYVDGLGLLFVLIGELYNLFMDILANFN